MRAGSATVDITPPLDTLLAGTAGIRREAEDVHDHLSANAIVLEQDGILIAFVSCDVLGLDAELVARIRDLIAGTTDLPAANVMLSATHTHTAPQTVRMFREPDRAYTEYFQKQVASAVRLAENRLEQAAVSIAEGTNSTYSHNRRFLMDDGEVLLTTQIADPLAVTRAEGPSDPTMSTLTVERPSGEVIGIIANYATHTALTTGSDVSADFPGVIRRTVRGTYGQDTVVVYMSGASGNVWPFTPDHPYKRVDHYLDPNDQLKAGMVGRSLAGSILACAEPYRHTATKEAALDVETRMEAVATRSVDPGRLARAREVESDPSTSKRERVFARNLQEFAAFTEANPTVDVEIQGIRVGDAVVVSVPAELFVEFGLEIREAVEAPVFVAGYTNGYLGYLPTDRAFGNGGYETTAGWVNRLDKSAGSDLTETMTAVARSLLE